MAKISVFRPDRVRQLQRDLEQVASATNLLRQQINGNVNSWSGDLPIWGAMHNAQQSIARLTDDAEQLAEVVRKAIAGMERLEQENKRSAAAWLDQTRGLAQLLARFRQHTMATLGPLPEEMMRSVNRLIDKVEAWHRPDPFEKEPVIQQLRERLASATLPQADRIRIKAQIEEIYAQREVIAKAQRAYEMYKQYGNTAQMLRVHQLAEDSRLRLLAMGIQAQTIAANVDLTLTYAGSAVQACTFDPLYTKPIPIMDSERYRTLLMLGMKEGATGTWARKQLEEIVFHRQQLTTSTISVMQQLREGKLPKQDLSTMSTSALQLSRYNLYSKPKAIVEEQEIKKEEPIYKQIWNSLKEIGNDAIAASNDRWDRQFDSVYDFVNYWSGGITGAVWEGAQERTNKWNDSVYDFSNYLLIGVPGMIKGMGDSINGTFFPAEAWSKEHVSDMLGAVSIVGGGVATSIGKKTILNPVKPDLTPPNAPKVDQIPDQKTKIEGPVNTVPVIKNNFEYIDSFADHMINAQGIVRKGNKGVVGGHNLESFEKILTDQGWKLDDVIVSRTPHPTVTGVYEIEYRLPAIDRELKVIPGQYKNIPQPKTVYDSNLISNEQMIVWGKEAMENGVINGRLVTGYSSNGLRFTGYLDDSGNITNFHPSFEGK
ncbi:EndoU domain-containing protein [Paenibacillus septentrionalis]